MITAKHSTQPFAVSGTSKVEFFRIPHLIHISIPTGSTATVDFDGIAASESISPMSLPAGVHTLYVPCGFFDIVVTGGGTVTGVGVSP